MKKVLLAVGHIDLEKHIKEVLTETEEYQFVGESVHRENILNLIKSTSPDILVIRETLPGKTNIINLVYTIRAHFQDVRIVFLAGDRNTGDELLSSLVNYGVYDILNSGSLFAHDIINLIQNPNTYQDVKHLQPVPDMEEVLSDLEFILPEDEKEEDIFYSAEEDDDIGNIEFVMPGDSFDSMERKRKKKIMNIIDENDGNDESDNSKPRRRIKLPTIVIPKIELPTFEKREREHKEPKQQKQPKESKFNKSSNTKNEKIITFWGSKNGVGTTTIAHNMAISLANEGNKVIYIELDNTKPSVPYWYDLGHLSEGIETFASYLEDKEYKSIESSIIKTKDLKENNDRYKFFPDSLDFLFFSKEYLSRMKPREVKGSLKDLYMFLLYQSGYDFVILDVANNIDKKDLIDMLMFSSLVFIVVSQDVSSLGYHTLDLDNLMKDGINIKDKSHYIVNKYVESDLNMKKIKEWVGVDKITSIPNNREVYINASLNSQPVIMNKQDGIVLRGRLEELKKII